MGTSMNFFEISNNRALYFLNKYKKETRISIKKDTSMMNSFMKHSENCITSTFFIESNGQSPTKSLLKDFNEAEIRRSAKESVVTKTSAKLSDELGEFDLIDILKYTYSKRHALKNLTIKLFRTDLYRFNIDGSKTSNVDDSDFSNITVYLQTRILRGNILNIDFLAFKMGAGMAHLLSYNVSEVDDKIIIVEQIPKIQDSSDIGRLLGHCYEHTRLITLVCLCHYCDIMDAFEFKKTVIRERKELKNKQLSLDDIKKEHEPKKEYEYTDKKKILKLSDIGISIVYVGNTRLGKYIRKGSNTRHMDGWDVTGHWRFYKSSGKRVWIEPYQKGEAAKTKKLNILVD